MLDYTLDPFLVMCHVLPYETIRRMPLTSDRRLFDTMKLFFANEPSLCIRVTNGLRVVTWKGCPWGYVKPVDITIYEFGKNCTMFVRFCKSDDWPHTEEMRWELWHEIYRLVDSDADQYYDNYEAFLEGLFSRTRRMVEKVTSRYDQGK